MNKCFFYVCNLKANKTIELGYKCFRLINDKRLYYNTYSTHTKATVLYQSISFTFIVNAKTIGNKLYDIKKLIHENYIWDILRKIYNGFHQFVTTNRLSSSPKCDREVQCFIHVCQDITIQSRTFVFAQTTAI